MTAPLTLREYLAVKLEMSDTDVGGLLALYEALAGRADDKAFWMGLNSLGATEWRKRMEAGAGKSDREAWAALGAAAEVGNLGQTMIGFVKRMQTLEYTYANPPRVAAERPEF